MAAALLVVSAPLAWLLLAGASDAACLAGEPGCASVAEREAPDQQPAPRALSLEARRPRYERVGGNIETLWQRPLAEPPKGLMFMAHGCMHQATDFFTQRGEDGWELPGCAHSNYGACLGLPEERVMVREARKHGYVVVAVSGGSGVQSCWNMHRDPGRVGEAIRHVIAAEGLPRDAPVLATGASSGGAFMGALAGSGVLGRQLRCIVPQISSIHVGEDMRVPTLFVHMSRDKRTAAAVKKVIAYLHSIGVQRAEELRVEPESLRSAFARHYAPGEAERMYGALSTAGLLDTQGLLQDDPRRRGWVRAMRQVAPKGDGLEPDESPVAEVLNAAWAFHEFTSRYAGEMLRFCEAELGKSR